MNKRIICFTISVIMLFIGCCGRCAYISLGDKFTVSDSYNSYSLVVDRMQPNLFYSNGVRMTNNRVKNIAVIRPKRECVVEVTNLFSPSERKEILNLLSKGYPIVYPISEEKKNRVKHIKVFEDYYTDSICSQLINKSSLGLLSYIDESEGGLRKINFAVDARGRLLSGDNGKISDMGYNFNTGYTLLVDEKIQKITYEACKDMAGGCAVVMDVENASILACVSKPDDTYINKPLRCYPVGSVFKTVVAACAIENNIDPLYNCVGSIKVGDTVYSCQGEHIHSYQNLKVAFANSCNCYFVNLALELGGEKILSTARKLGFYDKSELFSTWTINNAVMPSENALKSKGQLALFGFGQGEFMSTPLQICSCFCTIGRYGDFKSPLLVEKSNQVLKKSALDSSTCKNLLDYMRYVVTDGTGRNAETADKKSAGKTATAQTGQYIAGREILNTWFAGVYPYDNPKYAVVVMTENGKSGAEDCCPIFRTIVENIK